MTRKEVLERAEACVNGARENMYGRPENSFRLIANFWTHYLQASGIGVQLDQKDVAAMMTLLKIARVATGHGSEDNWIDIAGYAACGGEVQSMEGDDE